MWNFLKKKKKKKKKEESRSIQKSIIDIKTFIRDDDEINDQIIFRIGAIFYNFFFF